MNKYFDELKITQLYPGAERLMIPAMLIWKLPANKQDMMSEVCENGDYFAQPKIDGAWYQYVKGSNSKSYLFGRTISKVTGLMTEKSENVPHIMSMLDALPNDTVLIGEIYYPRCTAKDVVSIMGCLPEEALKRQNDPKGRGPIQYYIHDIIYYDGVDLMTTGAWDRYRILQAIWEKYNFNRYPLLQLAEAVEENIENEVSHILNSGGEGMVLKRRGSIYYPGKRPSWSAIKFKQMDDIDLVCTRTIPATREYTGKEIESWPYWQKHFSEGDVTAPVRYNEDGTPSYARSITSFDCSHYGEEGWEPVTKPYAFGWHTAIGIGAYDDNGTLVELGTVSSGLTDEDKVAMGANSEDFVGKVVSLHCMLIDKKEKTLRHPVFKGWRPDKNARECIISEVFK